MFDTKAYMKKWRQEHKDKVAEYNKKYKEKNYEKIKEKQREYRKNNFEKIRKLNEKSHQKFIESCNWAQYVGERRKARIERLRQQGVKNPWSVINGKEAKYE